MKSDWSLPVRGRGCRKSERSESSSRRASLLSFAEVATEASHVMLVARGECERALDGGDQRFRPKRFSQIRDTSGSHRLALKRFIFDRSHENDWISVPGCSRWRHNSMPDMPPRWLSRTMQRIEPVCTLLRKLSAVGYPSVMMPCAVNSLSTLLRILGSSSTTATVPGDFSKETPTSREHVRSTC